LHCEWKDTNMVSLAVERTSSLLLAMVAVSRAYLLPNLSR
jgi:hypothetical protein